MQVRGEGGPTSHSPLHRAGVGRVRPRAGMGHAGKGACADSQGLHSRQCTSTSCKASRRRGRHSVPSKHRRLQPHPVQREEYSDYLYWRVNPPIVIGCVGV